MPEYDQIQLATERFIIENPLILDNVFHRDPLFGYLRDTVEEMFTGGRRQVESDFEYDGETAAAYQPGGDFNLMERQSETAFALPIQFYYSNVTANLEDLEVFNKGSRAVYKFLDTRLSRAYRTLGEVIAACLYLNGSRAGYTNIITGLAEALNDGLTNSWDGQTYLSYGDKVRNSVQIGTALNSIPYSTPTTTITLYDLETSHARACQGEGEETPNIGVTTFIGFSSIKSRFQPQQRFNDTQDPKLNFNALMFNNTVLMRSRVAPGSYISGNQTNELTRIINAFLKESSNGVITAYPTMTTETLFWLNARRRFMRLLVSDSKKFGFGTTGWKAAQGNNKIACQILAALAYFVRSPRRSVQVYGFRN